MERINSYSHDCEAILIPGEGRIGSIFHYIHGRFDVHQRVYAITQFEPEMSAKFIHFHMSMNFGAWAMQNTVKATVDSLRLPTFQTFEMNLPPTFARTNRHRRGAVGHGRGAGGVGAASRPDPRPQAGHDAGIADREGAVDLNNRVAHA